MDDTVKAQATPDWPPTSRLNPSVDSSHLCLVQPEIVAALKPLLLSPTYISEAYGAIGSGTFGDVTKAIYAHPSCGKIDVAIKHLRIPKEKEIISLFEKEVYIWSKLNHLNVLPLIGFYFDKQYRYPSLVSEWMVNGDSWSYVKKNPDCNLIRLVTGAAEGLAYLHGMDAIHSDIKPDNILVNSEGDARICDFGGSRISDASESLVRPTIGPKGTNIYSAYELVVPNEIGGYTKKTDVWAFGMTIYALLTQQPPYDEDFQVYKLLSKPEPQLPLYPSSDSGWTSQRLEAKETFWNVCQLCWKTDPTIRADMSTILSHLPVQASPRAEPDTTQNEIESPPDLRSSYLELEDPLPLYTVRPDILTALRPLRLSPNVIINESKMVFGTGSFSDVTRANIGKMKVAIKRLRISISREKEFKYLFEKEVYVWSKFDHPNVLHLIGFYFDKQFGYPSLVSEWMVNGDSWSYVKKNPDCNLIRLVIGAAEGLAYLHGMDVIHSDIKPDNILVNSEGDARICGFSGSRINNATRSLIRPTDSPKGTKIYSAYELVVPDEIGGHTKKTDVWAFGMTIYALLTHQPPYSEDLQVYKFLSKPTPQLPPYPSSGSSWTPQRLEAEETFWNICKLCWKIDPGSRADMPSVLSILKTSSHVELESNMDVD